ncbi:MAG TPA: 50S ribosomal protein L11 methyltransferase [Steroidobacteraceae bacterium]|nr:50S ribosomal protein L11 methyltransferase [Steroidobacteraceae bacterium]
MTFYEIEFPLAALSPEAVEAALLEIGASSITFVDRGDEPVLEPKPGEVRLWSDTLVRALFQASYRSGSGSAEAASAEPASTDAARNLGRLAAVLGPHITETARVRRVENQEWERVWLTDWKSMRFGRRLWVCPTAAEPPDDPNAVVVRLDPGLAFGTGTHPTTALCLQILDSLPVAGRSAIDYGCGSGILGIAALKLGAAHVWAVDLDPQALLATRDNAIRNGVSSNIDVQGIEVALRPAYCVMANILAGPLIELAPTLTEACEPGGYLLLSGLLKTQAYEVKAAYGRAFDRVQVVERDDWCCIYAQRGA